MKRNINLKLLVLYLYAFILLYIPDFSYYINVDGVFLYSILTILFLAKNALLDKKFFQIFKKKPIFMFILFNILFTLYYMVRTSIAGVSIIDFYNLRILQNMIPSIVLIGVCIIYYELEKMNFNKRKKYKFIINLAIIQSLISLSMVLIPSFRVVAYNIFYKGSSDINIYISSSRLYGICDGNYTYGFQILTSFLAVFSFIFAYFYKEKKYYIFSLFILVTTILNGRFGIIIYGVSIALFIIYIIISEKKLITALKVSFIIFMLIGILWNVLVNYVPNTANLVVHAIEDITSFIHEKDSSTEVGMLMNSVQLPKGLDVIFGSGYRIYGGAGIPFGHSESTDIGFINDIFMAGIFSVILLYGTFSKMIFSIRKNKNNTKFERVMAMLLIVAMCMSNIKGELFRSHLQIAGIVLLLVFMLLGDNKNDKVFNNNTNI